MGYRDVLLMVAEGGALMDLCTGRIDNRWSLLGLGAGFFVHFLRDGPPGLLEAVGGALLPLLLLFPLFFFHFLGAGDIKLLCALGSFLNNSGCFTLLIFSVLAGGIFSVAILLHSGRLCRRFHQLILLPSRPGFFNPHSFARAFPLREGPVREELSCKEEISRGGPSKRRGDPSRLTLPFALPILLGTLIYAGGLSL